MIKQISSSQHPLVQYWLRLKSDPAFRRQEAKVLVEGRNCIVDVARKQPIKRLITLHPEELEAEEVVIVSEQILKKISSVETSSGVIAEFSLPPMKRLKGARLLACDRVQDPGNLGTLIRTAYAFGWDGLFLLTGSCDPFNDKALRASKGAAFSLPLMMGDWRELEEIAKENGLDILVADTVGKAPEHFPKEMKKMLILGNEARGCLFPEHLHVQKVALPMQGACESLNVAIAGSILMYLL